MPSRVPDIPPGFTPQPPMRFRRGWRRYVPDVVEDVRRLVEGSALTHLSIAKRTGVSTCTIFRWTRNRGWVRPAQAETWNRALPLERAGLGPPFRAAMARVARLAEREAERLAEPESGGARAEAREARRLAARARRAAYPYADKAGAPRLRPAAPPDDSVIVRLTRRENRRMAKPPGPDVFAKARELVVGTALPPSVIGRQLGICTATITRWTQAAGWRRPPDAPCPITGPRLSRGWIERSEARIEAGMRLREAERMLAALEREEKVEIGRIEAAFTCLQGAISALRKRRDDPALRLGPAGSYPRP